MSTTPAEMMKEYVNSQKFSRLWSAKLSDELGCEKSERMADSESRKASNNYRNGYSKKTVKTQLGEVDLKIPHTALFMLV